jgi:hypothetical protein
MIPLNDPCCIASRTRHLYRGARTGKHLRQITTPPPAADTFLFSAHSLCKHSHRCITAVTTARLNFLAAEAATTKSQRRRSLFSVPENSTAQQPSYTMEGNGNGVVRRKDTTKGPPLRILSLGEQSQMFG